MSGSKNNLNEEKKEDAVKFPDGIVTRQELKRLTGEFDLETIFQLDVSDRQLSGLGCLPDCTRLEFLCLAGNLLADASLLSGLKSLRCLDLSRNRLSSTTGLDGCEALEELDLAGNLIACTEDLRPLASLEHLRALRLQEKRKSLTNPLCLSAGYQAKLLDLLPAVSSLDGDRVRGTGETYFQLCQQVDRMMAENPRDSLPPRAAHAGSGLPSSYWSTPSSNESAAEAEKAEAEFVEALQRVRDQELRALLLIEQWERDIHRRQTA